MQRWEVNIKISKKAKKSFFKYHTEKPINRREKMNQYLHGGRFCIYERGFPFEWFCDKV